MLRPYQHKLKSDVYSAWNAGHRNVLATSPTGSGKTITMQSITDECQGITWSIAHRRELVGQISMAAAKVGCYHRIIAPNDIVKLIIALQIRKLGRSFVHQNANHLIASVQTINARKDIDEAMMKMVRQAKLWNMDEAHHIRADNIWGKCVAEFINAWGAGYTALAKRGDNKALGRRAGGVFDYLVIGPQPQELIDLGHLVPVIIYGPQISSIDTTNVEITASGDYSQNQLSKEARKSTIVGDIVRDYLRFAPGKRGLTFKVDVGMAEDVTQAFLQQGVPAALVTDKTPLAVRNQAFEDLEHGFLKQVVNVDIAGEGLDIPVVEVVSFGRPTESEQVCRQQGGRVIRLAPQIGKTHGIIIDHVKNIEKHGPPNKPAQHSLGEIEKKKRNVMRDPDEVPVRTCPKCWRTSETWSMTCPHCQHTPPPDLRDRPEQVEGDLLLYTEDLLRRLCGEADKIMKPPALPFSAGPAAVAGRRAQAERDQEAQRNLRDAMAWWAGVQRDVYGRSDAESYVRFYRKFGVDVASAQGLTSTPALALYDLIWKDIGDYVDRSRAA